MVKDSTPEVSIKEFGGLHQIEMWEPENQRSAEYMDQVFVRGQSVRDRQRLSKARVVVIYM